MTQPYQNILVAVDGSYAAEVAFNKALKIAHNNQAHLHIVQVLDTRSFQQVSSFDSQKVQQVTDKSKQNLDEYQKTALQRGIKHVSATLKYGAPKTTIALTYPKECNIDLIIVGATGLNAVERLLIGSVTEFTIQHAACDVMVVRTKLSDE
ncbi:universal stress protein [Bombilactobacillus thymidiniphilus]|uniref:Universal stress protein n=1 Tax=Bombilactobacillus thymidiniphilus TaxID=2923363 RepID=A0ABY4PDS8_9LACO|nr:universal stress protein [Bombilactobacillus thymidiniphilus]UQS83834.1 universal stress protein [Bombilactobacillus thymidiniphilus]